MRCLLICSLLILLANCIRAADVIKNEKVKLGKRTCTCTFTMETKGTRCSGQAKCDKKCTGTGAVDVDPYSFTLAVKKGKGKISKCTVAAMPTVGPVEPTGSGSGSGPVEPTGSGSGPVPTGSGEEPVPIGSGTGPVEPTGSGSGPPPMGEGMPCSCRCDCPDGGEQCDCDCNCPMMSTSVTCAPGFTRVCPMMEDVCPGDTMMMCPGGMAPAAGRMMHGSSGSSGCQCVPDFLMELVQHAMPAATRLDATDRATDVIKNEKVKLGKRTCTCTFTMETKGTRCSGQAKCDKKCTGTGAVDVDPYSFTLAVKKGKGKISKCTVAAMPTVGPVEPTGSGTGPVPTGSGTGPVPPTGSGSGMENPMSRCTCVGNGGSGPTPPTGSGTGPGPNPPTGTGSGSEASTTPSPGSCEVTESTPSGPAPPSPCDNAGCSLQTFFGTVETLSVFTKDIFAIWWDPKHDHTADAEPLADLLIGIRTDCFINLGMADPPNPGRGYYYNVYIHHGEDDLFPTGWAMGQGLDQSGNPYLTLGAGGMFSSTAYHEGFHIFQYDANSPGFAYAADSQWYIEATAQWYKVKYFRDDRNLYMEAGAILANPHLTLWHSFQNHGPDDPASNAGRPGWMYGVRQYGMHTYLTFLTDVKCVDRSFVTDGFYADTPMLPQEYLYHKVGPVRMRALFADWAAHNTGGLDYLTDDQVARAYLEITLAGDWDYFRPYIWSAVDQGTNGDWFRPPSDLTARGWAYNVFNINNTRTTSYTFELEGDATGSEGAESFFAGRIVVMSDNGPTYSDMTMTSPLTGTAAVSVTPAHTSVYLVVASVPEYFRTSQYYSYQVRISSN